MVAIGLLAPCAAAGNDAAFADGLTDLVNEYRAAQGRPALAPDKTIATLAGEHSDAMARAQRLSHDGFPSRVQRSGGALCVENVGWNYRSPRAQLDAWRASPGHDRNMLDARVDRIGIGTADAYVTMIACGR